MRRRKEIKSVTPQVSHSRIGIDLSYLFLSQFLLFLGL